MAEVYRRDYHKRSSPPLTAARLAFDSREPKLAIALHAILARDSIDE